MDRRSFLASSSVAAAAAAGMSGTAMAAVPRTFVLVHGAWHGGWCWRRVARYLRVGGHEVYAPSLTGLGDRSHLLNPAIDLGAHVRDLVDLMEFEDLTDVVLVGHSYAGMVIAGAAELAPSRISKLVYLNAVTPKDGQSFSDLAGPEVMTMFREIAEDQGGGWCLPCPTDWTFGITEPDLSWAKRRMTPQPMATLEQKVRLVNPEALALPRSFIWCAIEEGRRQESPRDEFSAGWDFYELEAEHDAMITNPRELADVLLRLAPKG